MTEQQSKPDQVTRVFLPNLPEGWTWAVTAENVETGETVTVSFDKDGWESMASFGRLARAHHASLRDALLHIVDRIRKVMAARERYMEASQQYASVLGISVDQRQGIQFAQTPGFADAQTAYEDVMRRQREAEAVDTELPEPDADSEPVGGSFEQDTTAVDA